MTYNLTIRKSFEAWAKSKKLPITVSTHFTNEGTYSNQDTHVAWLAWQAAWEQARCEYRELNMFTDEQLRWQ